MRLVVVRRWVGRNLVTGGLALALVVAVVLLTLSQLSLNRANSIDRAEASALASAKSYAVDLSSYNYQHLAQDFGKVRAESTPTFEQSFTQSSTALERVLVRYDASAQAKVVSAGLVSASGNRAVVLVVLSQTVENTSHKSKPTSESRVEITLWRGRGRWMINQVKLL